MNAQPTGQPAEEPYAAAWRRYRRWCAVSLVAVATMVFIVMPVVAWRRGGITAGGIAVFFGYALLIAIPLNMVKFFRCPRCHNFFDWFLGPYLVSTCSRCGSPKGAVADPSPRTPKPAVNVLPKRGSNPPRPHGSPGAR
jgi:hypothetical protein